MALDEVICGMIKAHQGKPCPTRQDVIEWTGLPRYRVWPYIADMAERKIVEMETNGPKKRRLRVLEHAYTSETDWTLWTAEGREGNPAWLKAAD